MSTSRSSRFAKGALALAAPLLAGLALTGSPAHADPKQQTALVAVGSDTTQDILNALAGNVNGVNYTPLQSTTGNQRQLISFDAVAPAGSSDNCITTRVKAATVLRPNGSTNGRRALSRAISPAASATDATIGWGASGQCGGVQDVSGLFDFARSSSGPSSGDTGTALTYIPFGRDAMTLASVRVDGDPITNWTRAQINSLFTTGPQTIDPDGAGPREARLVIPCGLNAGSGTFSFWQTVNGSTTTQEANATTLCNGFGGVPLANGRVQENSGSQLGTKAGLADANTNGAEVVAGFSCGNFVAQTNGAAINDLGPVALASTTGGLWAIDDDGLTPASNLGLCYNPPVAPATTVSPRTSFYDNARFGRNIYNVFNTNTVTGIGNNDIKSMFVGSTSALCSAPAQAIVNTFGFTTLTSGCGSTTLKGSLITGNNPT